jgi:hypothetical protein
MLVVCGAACAQNRVLLPLLPDWEGLRIRRLPWHSGEETSSFTFFARALATMLQCASSVSQSRNLEFEALISVFLLMVILRAYTG